MKQLPDNVTPSDFKFAMNWYCHRPEYQKAMLKHTQRINLQGELVDEVKEIDKKVAQERMDRIQNQPAKPQKAKRVAKPESLANSVTEPVVEIEVIEVIEMIEIIEPAPPVEEVKPKKLALKRKVVEPVAEVITPVEVKSIPAPVKVPSGNVAVAKGLKVTLVIEPASIPNIDSTGMKKVTLTVQVANTDIQVTADLSAKSYRKAMSGIEEFGVDGCNAILQGAMKRYGVIDDAGLVVQPKKVAVSE